MRLIMDELISVIIPAYNIDKYINDCLRSIECQTYTNLEIIVVNDGSTDNTREIIEEHKANDYRINVVHQENQGLVSARKRGLEMATGKLCMFIDGDDWIDKELIRSMFFLMKSGEYDAVHANFIEECNGNSRIHRSVTKNEVLELNCIEKRIEVLRRRVLASTCDSYITPSIWARIYNTDLVRKLYFLIPNEQSYGEDVLFLMHLLMNSERILLTEKAFYHYRVLDNSLSHNYGLNNLTKITTLYLNMKIVIKDYGIYDNLAGEVDSFYWEKVLQGIKQIEAPPLRIGIYMFPDQGSLIGKRIILYGAGSVGKDYYTQITGYENTDIISWVDKRYDIVINGYRIRRPDVVLEYDRYDLILLAVNDESVAREISKELEELGVPNDRIIWEKPLSAYNLMRRSI